jgi:hypothetical protein
LAVRPDHTVEEGEDDEEKGKDIGDYGEGRREGTYPLAPVSKLALLIPKSSSGSSELGSCLPRQPGQRKFSDSSDSSRGSGSLIKRDNILA